MKNFKLVIAGLLSLLIIGAIVYKFSQTQDKNFGNVRFINENTVTNQVDKPYLDTVIRVALDQLDIQNVHVIFFKLDEQQRQALGGDIKIEALVKKYAKGYIIYISDLLSKDESIKVLSHEAIHIKQYESERLVVQNPVVFFENIPYYPKEISYEDRPWEIEAFFLEGELTKKVNKTLYQ